MPLLNEIQEAIENKILILSSPDGKERAYSYINLRKKVQPPLQFRKSSVFYEIVATFHNIPAGKLRDIVKCKDVHDSIICSDDEEAKKLVMELTKHMGCLKPLDGGPLKQASTIESLTPLMINLARLNQLKDLGINFS